MLRVIAGNLKGRKLVAPPHETRPVTDRIKTIVFDLLREFIPNARILDLYAGSGAFGIEAISRGARHCTFVEGSAEAIAIIKQNLVTCQIPESDYAVVNLKLPEGMVSQELNAKLPVDVVFCDPPFTNPKTFSLRQYDHVIKNTDLFMVRLPSDYKLPESDYTIVHQQTIGVSQLVFLRTKS
jgi:16S rRNA (guanine966-N2)-methyltransferase